MKIIEHICFRDDSIQLDQKEELVFFSPLKRRWIFQVNDELQVAVRNNDVEAVKAAIEEGADVNVHDEEGWTPLMWAALHQSLDMVPGGGEGVAAF